MEQLANLPPLALVFFGITTAIIFAARHFGLSSGANLTPEKSASVAQVATIIVDPTALNAATAAVKDLTKELNDGRVKESDHAHMICRRLEGLSGEVSDLTRAVNALMVEMARKR